MQELRDEFDSFPYGEETDPDARNLAMACHLSPLAGYIVPFGNLLGPLALWLWKRNDHPFVDDQGREALNFQISVFLYAVVAGLLTFVLIGFVLLPLLVVFQLVVMILAAIKASRGEAYRYPLCLRLVTSANTTR